MRQGRWPKYGSWAHKTMQGGGESLAAQFHAAVVTCTVEMVAVAVNDRADRVALAVAKAGTRGGVEALAQGQGRFQQLDKQGLVYVSGLRLCRRAQISEAGLTHTLPSGAPRQSHRVAASPGAKSVSGLCFTSHFIGEYPRCPARRRRSSIF